MCKIVQYQINGSRYRTGGKVYELNKPQAFRDKTNKTSGVSLGADKNGFFVFTHRARSDSYESPEKIPIKDINFIDSTG